MLVNVTSVAQLREIVRLSPIYRLYPPSLPLTSLSSTQMSSNEYSLVDFHADWCGPCHVRRTFLSFPLSLLTPSPIPHRSWRPSSTSSPRRPTRSASTRSTSMPSRRFQNSSAAFISCPLSSSTSPALLSTPWPARTPKVSGYVPSHPLLTPSPLPVALAHRRISDDVR